MPDELAKAITNIVYPALKPEGFRRARKRDLIRVENGIVHLLYFQVSGWGSRDFCVTASANLVAGCEGPRLQPGFRLNRDTDGGDLWLQSLTPEQAQLSAESVLGSIRAEALPYFERLRTPAGFSALLAQERWGANHHLCFQRGVSKALEGDVAAAKRHLADAVDLYEADGEKCCASYIVKAKLLSAALNIGDADALLNEWREANSKAHGIRPQSRK
jgi:hypothetical protein